MRERPAAEARGGQGEGAQAEGGRRPGRQLRDDGNPETAGREARHQGRRCGFEGDARGETGLGAGAFECPAQTGAAGKADERPAGEGSLHRMTDRLARRDAAALTPHELVAALRDNAHHRWKPPMGGPPAALGHDVIHGLDITVALGLGRQVPQERLRIVLDTVAPRTLRFFEADLGDVELRATDLEWSYGRGTQVPRPAQELLLLAYGRKLPAARTDG